jgi:hypothetical protein
VASRARQRRYTPQLPLATPKDDPATGTSVAEPSIYVDFHYPPISTLVVVSHFPITPYIGDYRSLNFGSFPVDFPSPSFTPPPHIIVFVLTERETSVPSIHVAFSPNLMLFPSSPGSTSSTSLVQTPSPHGYPPFHVKMASANPPRNRMVEILAVRYAPLVLP